MMMYCATYRNYHVPPPTRLVECFPVFVVPKTAKTAAEKKKKTADAQSSSLKPEWPPALYEVACLSLTTAADAPPAERHTNLIWDSSQTGTVFFNVI